MKGYCSGCGVKLSGPVYTDRQMLLVVGGHSRNIGKTSVASGIIRGLRDFDLTAIKISGFGHHAGANEDAAGAISEETGLAPNSDSGRFLAAGARRAFWVRTPAGGLTDVLPGLRAIIAGTQNVIIESNSILEFLRPDVCVMVLNGAVADFKPSCRRFLDRADFLVVTSEAPLVWPVVPVSVIEERPRYAVFPPGYESVALMEAIRLRASVCCLPGIFWLYSVAFRYTLLGDKVIGSIKHKGLRRLYEQNDGRGIRSDLVERALKVLSALEAAEGPQDMALPMFRFHPLTGDRRGTCSVTVKSNWRITFRFDNGAAHDVNLEDYH